MMFLNLRTGAIRLAVVAVMTSQMSVVHCEEVSVKIDNFTFEPAQLTVKVGTTVTWTNRDDIPHTVVSAGKFRSKAMDTDDRLLVHLHQCRRLQIFLLAAFAHGGDDQG